MDLFASLAFKLSHSKDPAPNGFEVGRQMAFARQTRPVPADQAEFVIWHGVSSLCHAPPAKRPAGTKVPLERLYLKLERPEPANGEQRPDCGQPAATFTAVLCDFRSKNNAWLITALTESALNGLVIRNAGSGACPVRKRSGKAVMKITGTS